ncbi:Ig-like domain-containing alpha-2-macroglobulin family protein [Nannocystis punicea]|uniref:MG2 domain-containing protein n=1 Tax=Nannocystis punicea TaxID=2995304 RepID=A0ABY7GVS0_9BACT|nr:Ig-like domain-containing alpha-2-macroglobulin family protein [Nannocystis poenicansa]WAS91057.1 MG2 domain-containing protein [Nannocystis poenicansa]
MRPGRPLRIVCVLHLSLALMTSCPATKGSAVVVPVSGEAVATESGTRDIDLRSAPEDAPEGLEIRLRASEELRPLSAAGRPPARAEPLPEARAAKLLARLPALTQETGDKKTFALREQSLAAPRPGKTVQQAFPPPAEAPAPERAEAGPLAVTRAMPEGEVELAPHLAVSFSQPMVAVTSHAELAKLKVPVELSPQPPGSWRWVGAKTVMFEPEGRFPMATEYRVRVPGQVKSSLGGALAKAKEWTFATPPPTVLNSWPQGGPHELEPVMVVSFDQKIDPQAVLEVISVDAGGKRAIRLATQAELEADEVARQQVAASEPGRTVAFRAVEPLPRATVVTVTVGPGTPSAEGPRKAKAPYRFAFQTYGPMTHVGAHCGWGDQCRPLTPLLIEFSNAIDLERFDPKSVHVEPSIPGMNISASGNMITVAGATAGRTMYSVTVDAGLRDVFGQASEKPAVSRFTTTRAEPQLQGPNRDFLVVDPAGGSKLSVFTINRPKLKVRLYAVTPEDYGKYLDYRRDMDCRDGRAIPPPPGKLVATTTVKVADKPDALVETAIDLSPALKGGLGNVIAFVEPPRQPWNCWERQYVMAWAQVTRIGLTAFVDHGEMVAWATNLADGAPLAGVDVKIAPRGGAGQSAADGLVTLPLADRGQLLIAKKGGDTAFVAENMYYYQPENSGWSAYQPGEDYRFYVAEDRGLYKPGETAKVKGWVRSVGGGERGDIGLTSAKSVTYRLYDPRGSEVRKGEVPVNAAGGFELTLGLPSNMNTGQASLQIQADSRTYYHTLKVEEFRRPEYEVKVEASPGPHLVGTSAELTLTANYFSGGGLAGADVDWRVHAEPAAFTPPGLDEYSFGFTESWYWWRRESRPQGREFTFTGKTDAAGAHRIRADFVWSRPARAYAVIAEGSAQDVNRQKWTGRTRLVVHPADLYVGLKTPRPFYNKGDKFSVDAVVADLDGKLVEGRAATILAQQFEWVQERGEWKEKVVDTQTCPISSSKSASRCDFEARRGGTLRLEATVADARGRASVTRTDLWVAGGDTPPSRTIEQEKVGLLADKKEYGAGDVAELLVVSPWPRAEGVLTIRRSGLVRSERFKVEDGAAKLRVPIEEAHVPNLHVHVDLVGAAPRTRDDGTVDPSLSPRPAYAAGALNLRVPPRRRTLQLTVKPRDEELPPGAKTVVDVELRDAEGKPVAGGEVALAVVDEALLSLTGYRWPDPVATFYVDRDGGVREHHLRELLLLARPDLAKLQAAGPTGGSRDDGGYDRAEESPKRKAKSSPGMAAPDPAPVEAPTMPDARQRETAKKDEAGDALERDSGAQEDAAIALRTDFSALALFAAAVPTDSEGQAQVELKLPDNLTRYRVMAVAAGGVNAFGGGEATVTASRPLMVRPSPPRFLNFGDKVELPVVVQNQGKKALTVEVAVRAANAKLTAGTGRKVQVPAGDRVEVRFPTTTEMAGTARFQFAAASGQHSDAAELSLPVWTPATTEAFATYGTLDSGAVAQPVKAPAGVWREFGGLEVTTTSTAVAGLTDALLYLVRYPFDCAEQVSSRVMAIAALRDVLTAFAAEGLPPPKELEASVRQDLLRLGKLQNHDGGWGFWRWGERSYPYLSIHVAHALARADAKGFGVSKDMTRKAVSYLQSIRYRIPESYGPVEKQVLRAYALYTLRQLGHGDPTEARALIKEAGGVEKMGLEAVAWLYSALQGDAASTSELEAIRRIVRNRAEETAGAAHFVTSYSDAGHVLLHSDRRVDALMLEALIADQPKSDLIPKLVEGLMAHRKAGRWTSTQENAFVLVALDRYFNTYEKIEPDFVARAWLGPRYAGEQKFVGRQTDRRRIDIPMADVAEIGSGDLILQKEGKGRLYYRIGMRYAPSDMLMPPADHGFVVDRAYEAIDDPKDVSRDADGTWRIKGGARVRVRLTMVAPTRRYHVALVDPLPAGLEPQNPALMTTGSLPEDPQAMSKQSPWWWWNRPWFEHQNLRDERAEAFTSLLWEGVHTYTYVALATTPGVFVVPPPKAEEMYHPETFGRGWSAKVIVE